MATVLSHVPAGKRLDSCDANWAERLCDDVYSYIFGRLDIDPIWDSEGAGKAATLATDALGKYLAGELCVDADPPTLPGAGITTVPDFCFAAGFVC